VCDTTVLRDLETLIARRPPSSLSRSRTFPVSVGINAEFPNAKPAQLIKAIEIN
jgi:hypothetical protein